MIEESIRDIFRPRKNLSFVLIALKNSTSRPNKFWYVSVHRIFLGDVTKFAEKENENCCFSTISRSADFLAE